MASSMFQQFELSAKHIQDTFLYLGFTQANITDQKFSFHEDIYLTEDTENK